jgi:hypothetical protein
MKTLAELVKNLRTIWDDCTAPTTTWTLRLGEAIAALEAALTGERVMNVQCFASTVFFGDMTLSLSHDQATELLGCEPRTGMMVAIRRLPDPSQVKPLPLGRVAFRGSDWYEAVKCDCGAVSRAVETRCWNCSAEFEERGHG